LFCGPIEVFGRILENMHPVLFYSTRPKAKLTRPLNTGKENQLCDFQRTAKWFAAYYKDQQEFSGIR